MGILEQLKAYDFKDFKLGDNYPSAENYYRVLKEIPPHSDEHNDFWNKMSIELGFDIEKDRGIYYYTMIRYLALALENIESKQAK